MSLFRSIKKLQACWLSFVSIRDLSGSLSMIKNEHISDCFFSVVSVAAESFDMVVAFFSWNELFNELERCFLRDFFGTVVSNDRNTLRKLEILMMANVYG